MVGLLKPFIEHVSELRKRFISVIWFFIIFFFIGFYISPHIISQIIKTFSFNKVAFVSLTPLEFISTQIRISIVFALVILSPLILYHLVKFIKPAAKGLELNIINYFLPISLILFFLGSYFCYSALLKPILLFLAQLSAASHVQNIWSISQLISFVIMMCLAFGLIFQLPLVILILGLAGIVNRKMLSEKRPYLYVFIFIIAAIITPTVDIFTQLLFALPMIVLYEISMILLWFFRK